MFPLFVKCLLIISMYNYLQLVHSGFFKWNIIKIIDISKPKMLTKIDSLFFNNKSSLDAFKHISYSWVSIN